MEREVNLSRFPFKKKFGHCKVEWIIENFCLQTSREDWEIRSPEFSINGSEETKWCMILQPKTNDKNYSVSFNLKRAMVDMGPEEVFVDLETCFTCSDRKHFHGNGVVRSFKNGAEYEKRLGRIEYFLTQMKAFESDLFTVMCRMIVYNADTSKLFEECRDDGIKLLSENMLNLYVSGQDYDVKLIIDDNTIKAHKTILCNRSEELSLLIEEEEEDFHTDNYELVEYSTVDFSGMFDYKALNKTLAYLYSGDLKHVLGEPSHEILECVCMLEIGEIEEYYEPDTLTLRSFVDIELITVAAFITDIDTKCYEKCIFRIGFATHNSVTDCQLYFWLEGKENSSLLLCKENFEVNTPASACVEFAVGDEYQRYIFPGNFTDSVDGSRYIELGKCSRDLAQHYLADGRLKIIVKLKLSADIKDSRIDKQSNLLIKYEDEDFCYEYLSMDLSNIHSYGDIFSDVIIDNYGVLFSAHKCILASRSKVFSDILSESESLEDVEVFNVLPYILCIILNYIYSGVLLCSEPDKLVKVYEAAVLYDLPHLKSKCSNQLQLVSETDLSISCRAMKIAEVYEDKVLKECILNSLYNTVFPLPVPDILFSFSDVSACDHC